MTKDEFEKCAVCGITIRYETKSRTLSDGGKVHAGKCATQATKGIAFLPFEDCEPRAIPEDHRTLCEVRKTSRYSRAAVRDVDA